MDPRKTAPSLADQWRRHLQAQEQDPTRPVLLDLPSGMPVTATRTNLLILMRRGSIPDALLPRVESLIATAQGGGDEAVRVALNRRLADNPAAFQAEWLRILDAVWMSTVVEPRFSDDPTDAEAIPLDAVSEQDKTFLFSWCQGVAESAAEFLDRSRARAAAPVGDAPVGDGVRDRPADVPGDRFEA